MEENDYLCTQNQSSMEKKLIEIIKANLKDRGISQADIANVLGVTRPAVSQMFTETMPLKRLQQFADIAHCSASELLDGADMPTELKIQANGQEYIYELKK